MSGEDETLRDALAYALWRSPWRTRLGGLDACRLAAADLVRHLRRAGYEVRPGPPMEPHGGLSRGAPDDQSSAH
ncbi:MAG: hypothetical protein ABL308_08845 [Oceanicaulis sp.]